MTDVKPLTAEEERCARCGQAIAGHEGEFIGHPEDFAHHSWACLPRVCAQLDAERAARAEAEAKNVCDACAGTGKPISGMKCMCGGTGRMSDAAICLRETLIELEAATAKRIAEWLRHGSWPGDKCDVIADWIERGDWRR